MPPFRSECICASAAYFQGISAFSDSDFGLPPRRDQLSGAVLGSPVGAHRACGHDRTLLCAFFAVVRPPDKILGVASLARAFDLSLRGVLRAGACDGIFLV